jgi:hypothetical protein
MQAQSIDPRTTARAAGLLYLVIIVAGIGGEVLLRAPLVVPDDAAGTAARIAEALGTFRLSIAADAVMAMADVALAALLFLLFRLVSLTLSLMAMTFRLVQAAILGMNLVSLQSVTLALATGLPAETVLFHIEAHAQGYDMGLIFFGVNSLLTGWLIVRSGFLPKTIGVLLAGAGAVYLTGSALRILAPEMLGAFEMAYLLPLVAETAMALWLVVRTVDARTWRARAA